MPQDYTDFFDLSDADAAVRESVRADFIQAFQADLRGLGLSDRQSHPLAQELWQQMSAPGRHYHTAMHVLGMFDYARKYGVQPSDIEKLAIWYHDYVYDVQAPPGRNEFQSSIEMVGRLLELGVDEFTVGQAAECIRWTARHLDFRVPQEHELLLDLDLASFSAKPDSFARQSAALRLEFPHLRDKDYNTQTVAFLGKLLERPELYRIPELRPLEVVARRQILNEIHRLNHSMNKSDANPVV